MPDGDHAKIAEQIRSLLDQLGPTETPPDAPEEGTFWSSVQAAISDAYLDHAAIHGTRGGQAIIMAGPPGAGKSQAVAIARDAAGTQATSLGLTEDDHITIDADDIKQILLGNPVPDLDIDPDVLTQARHHWDSLITQHAPGNLADGHPVLRGELSTLVHSFSTAIAEQVRKALLTRSFNIFNLFRETQYTAASPLDCIYGKAVTAHRVEKCPKATKKEFDVVVTVTLKSVKFDPHVSDSVTLECSFEK